MINPVKDDTGQFTKSLSETMLTIIKHHFTYDSLVLQTDDMNSIIGNLEEYKEILTQEVEEIRSKIKLNKAPGPDNIPGEVVKEMFYANRNWFTDLFNKLLKSGLFPTSWKTANVVLIPKEKKDLNMAEHYRPICLLSSWGKTFDKLIAKRIVYYLEQINFFNPNQFGFRRKKSTITAIQNIKSSVYQASDENKMVCIISLDIKNAFNSVNWNLLKSEISKLPIPSYLIRILFDFLNNRLVLHEGEKISYNQGIPQGSCLGPILWNIYINDLLDLKLESETIIQAFADDIILMLKDRASYLFRDKSNKPLEMIFNWTQANIGFKRPLNIKLQFLTKLYDLMTFQEELAIDNVSYKFEDIDDNYVIKPPWVLSLLKWNYFTNNYSNTIFTDRSKKSGKTAFAFVYYKDSIEVYNYLARISDYATIFMAELLAISCAVDFIIKMI
ncbi:probable RNA-directed DNA polymerase from transposon BS [Caerostris darwini]|uniref:Probable RNA-directed DNA polymerase from transposon BS n=1 Tax=Caerostris darwini TaxID=1538125 RepID=A0AAV4V0V4_9ARAC|nr:probable RNA-directed DNA polymerase from transposon BS [Caerostris darwini]